MRMRFARIVLFLVIGCAIGHAVAALGDRLEPPRNFWHVERQRLRELQRTDVLESVEIVGAGNSHAAALDEVLAANNGRPLMRAGGDLLETSRSIQYWIPRMPSVHTVYLSASYFILRVDNSATPSDRQNRIMYYAINPTLLPIRDDIGNFILGKFQIFFPILRIASVSEEAWLAPLAAVGSTAFPQLVERREAADSDSLSRHALDAVEDPSGCGAPSEQELTEMAIARVAEYEMRARAQRPDLSSELYDELVYVASYLAERRIRLILVTPPYFVRYNEEFERRMPDVLAEFHASMLRLSTERGVEYRDYSSDVRWTAETSYFSDSDHFNACGKRSFMRALAAEIKTVPLP